MTIATWKDLCVDAVDAPRLGRFWADALGLTLEPLDDGDVRLDGATPQHRIWVNTVPEPVTVKQRVHLDVYARRVGDVLALGAVAEDLDSFSWQVLRDPEGGELCVFERAEVPDDKLCEICVDSADPQAMARWWADTLGGTVQDHDQGWSSVEGIPGVPFAWLVFNPVPEPKTVKNRIHWDVDTADLALLTDAGATVLRARDSEIGWTVMGDPEGNEFCAFSAD